MPDYRSAGRFAPSPTGPLHFGSLISAVASYLDIKQRQGRWLVRIEDIDPPREVPGASATILRQLDAHGLLWDDSVLYQSEHLSRYLAAADQLQQQDLTYFCQCSRQRIGSLGGIYDGHCRDLQLASDNRAMRLKLGKRNSEHLAFSDSIMGHYEQSLAAAIGDFVLRRRDGLVSYQLAVVVDDYYQNITHVLRGSDLLDSTPRQLYIQQCLDYPQPVYMHVPVALNNNGQKLSKQNRAATLRKGHEANNLYAALVWLQQEPPAEIANLSVAEIIQWGIEHWSLAKIPRIMGLDAPDNQLISD
jgi:glutamyl-Q tRNA(Asp) synthetase